MNEYVPPTWNHNYDNRHLVEEIDGKIVPNEIYRRYAEDINATSTDGKLIWDTRTCSYVFRFNCEQ